MDANDLGPLFRLPRDPHYLWIVGVAVAVLAIAVLLVGLLRGRLPATLLLPALLLPVAAYGIGYLFMLEASKDVAFCGSCHETMSPVVAALEQDNGTLSSFHWRQGAVSHVDACFQCHSGYGIWGEASAKISGVMHMVRTVTGRYQFPIRAQHFDNASCLGCHAEAAPFRAQDAHHDPQIQQQLLSNELGCAGTCHDAAHPEEALWGVKGPPPGAGK
jgi:cytochrome c nitrite reductase small subunit